LTGDFGPLGGTGSYRKIGLVCQIGREPGAKPSLF